MLFVNHTPSERVVMLNALRSSTDWFVIRVSPERILSLMFMVDSALAIARCVASFFEPTESGMLLLLFLLFYRNDAVLLR